MASQTACPTIDALRDLVEGHTPSSLKRELSAHLEDCPRCLAIIEELGAPPEQWSALAQNDTEFTRVRLQVTFPGAGDALVYAGGSSVRDDVKEPGYFVFSLARLPDGRQIAVNRGFTLSRSYPAPPASQEIVGSLRWPEAPSWFVAAHDTSGEIWTARDTPAMASLKVASTSFRVIPEKMANAVIPLL